MAQGDTTMKHKHAWGEYVERDNRMVFQPDAKGPRCGECLVEREVKPSGLKPTLLSIAVATRYEDSKAGEYYSEEYHEGIRADATDEEIVKAVRNLIRKSIKAEGKRRKESPKSGQFDFTKWVQGTYPTGAYTTSTTPIFTGGFTNVQDATITIYYDAAGNMSSKPPDRLIPDVVEKKIMESLKATSKPIIKDTKSTSRYVKE
jgi:hypothetical protein